MLRRRLRRKGFSLVELLIVIAIIGIIATIAIPILLSARQGAIREKARNSLRAVVSAEFAYYAKNGAYGAEGDLTGATPPFIDATSFGDDIGQGIACHVNSADTDLFNATATVTLSGVLVTFTATQTGAIIES